jgi:hypothetical protein
MLRSFVDWLDEYLVEVGARGLVAGGLGILAFGSLLAALLGESAVKAAAVVVVLLSLLGSFLVVAASRLFWRARATTAEAALRRSYDRQLGDGPYWTVKKWQQTIRIAANGDATLSVTVHCVSDRDSLSFFRIRFGPGWNQPVRYRSRVRAQVRSLQLEDVGGVKADEFQHWRDDGKLEIYVDFPAPIPIGGKFRFVADLEWPARCRPLARDGRPEEFCVTAGPAMELLEYTVVLPPGREAFYDPIGFTVAEKGLMLVSRAASDGRAEIYLKAKRLGNGRRVGMRVELK